MRYWWLPVIVAGAVFIINIAAIARFQKDYQARVREEYEEQLADWARQFQGYRGALSEDQVRSGLVMADVRVPPSQIAEYERKIRFRQQRLAEVFTARLPIAVGVAAFLLWGATAVVCWSAMSRLANSRTVIGLGLALAGCEWMAFKTLELTAFTDTHGHAGVLHYTPVLFGMAVLVLPILFAVLAARGEQSRPVLAGAVTGALLALATILAGYSLVVGGYWDMHLTLLFGMGTFVIPHPYRFEWSTLWLVAAPSVWAVGLGSLGGSVVAFQRRVARRRLAHA